MATFNAGSNSDTSINSITGGAIRVTIPATPFKVQANAGVSQPCRTCYISLPAANTGTYVRVNIDAEATSTLGLEIVETQTPFEIRIDDVSKLYFCGTTENDVVDILWRS